MAVTGAHLITNSSTANATSYTTASMTPLANRLVLAFVLSAKTSAPSPLVPTLTGNGMTWVQVATVTFATVATGLYRLTLFRAMGAAPTAGTLVISFGAVTQQACAWAISQYDVVETSGTNGSGAIGTMVTDNGDTVSTLGADLTLPSFRDSFSATVAAFATNGDSTFTPEAGWTEWAESPAINNPNMSLQSQWRASNDLTPSATWADAHAGGIAVEVLAGVRRAQVSWLELEVPELPETGNLNLVASTAITLIDVLALELPLPGLVLSETLTLTQALDLAVTITLAPEQTVTLTETPAVVNALLPVVASTPLTLTESVTPDLYMTITAAQAVTLTEASTLAVPIAIDLTQSLTLTESSTLSNAILPLLVAQDATITEAGTLSLTSIGGLTLNASDTIALTEATSAAMLVSVLATQALTLTEAVSIVNAVVLPVSTQDITLTETLTLALPLPLSAASSLTVTESLVVDQPLALSTATAVSLTDAATVSNALVPLLATADLTITEAITVVRQDVGVLLLTPNETITLTEAGTLTNALLPIVGSEPLTLTESATITQTAVGVAQVVAEQAVTLTDTATLVMLIPGLTLTQAITVADAATLSVTRHLSLTQTVTLADAASVVNARGVLQPTETVSLAESATLVIPALAPRTLTVAESLTVTETVSLANALLRLVMVQAVSLSEALTAEVPGLFIPLNVGDAVTVTDSLTLRRTAVPTRTFVVSGGDVPFMTVTPKGDTRMNTSTQQVTVMLDSHLVALSVAPRTTQNTLAFVETAVTLPVQSQVLVMAA